MVVEGVTAALVIVLGVVTLIAAYIGLLSLSGALRLARCQGCDKLVVTKAAITPDTCPFCRHDRLLHPVHAVRHQPS